jgi:hypothetical protein
MEIRKIGPWQPCRHLALIGELHGRMLDAFQRAHHFDAPEKSGKS